MVDYSRYLVNPQATQDRGMQTLMQSLLIRRQREKDAVAAESNALRDSLVNAQLDEIERKGLERNATRSVLQSGFTTPEDTGQRILAAGGDTKTAISLLGQNRLTGDAKNLEILLGRQPTMNELAEYKEKTNASTTVNLPTQEKEYDKNIGKLYAEEYKGILDEGKDAWNNNARLSKAEYLVKRINTGALKPSTTAVKRVMSSLGFDLANLGLKDDVGLAQALNAVSIDLTMDVVQRTKGAVSNKEMDLFAQVAPRLSNTVEGNLLIIRMAKKLNDNKIAVSNLARKYAKNKGGRFDDGFYDELNKFHESNPLFTEDVWNEVNLLAGAAKEAQDRDLTTPEPVDLSNVPDDELKTQLGIQ